MALISELCGRFYGKPILVIGGGPSVEKDILKIPLDYPGLVISANGHGFKQDRFEVDFIVNVDWLSGYSKREMREELAAYHTPVINRWSWAHFRIPEFSFCGDSGLTAIVVAGMLGGHPVIPLGIDRYNGNKRYFWQEQGEPGWNRRPPTNRDHVRVTTQACIDYMRGTQVRMFDGVMRSYWPEWSAAEVLPAFKPFVAPQVVLTGHKYQVNEPIFIHPTDRVDTPIILTDNEARPHLRARKIQLCTSSPPAVAQSDAMTSLSKATQAKLDALF